MFEIAQRKKFLSKFVTIKIFIEKCVLIGKCASSYLRKSAKFGLEKIREIFYLASHSCASHRRDSTALL
jgi:hypothetical protein